MTFSEEITHAHVTSEGSDCDGRHGNYYLVWCTDDESEYQFDHAMLSMTVGYSEFKTTLTITPHEDGTKTYYWSTATDEGWRSEERVTCKDECEDERSQYDQFAELAGY